MAAGFAFYKAVVMQNIFSVQALSPLRALPKARIETS